MPIHLRPPAPRDYTVLFDGTDACPQGRYLSLERDPPRPPPPVSTPRMALKTPLVRRALAALEGQEATVAQLAVRLGQPQPAVHRVVQRLVHRQRIDVVDTHVHPDPRPGQHKTVAVYGVR
jgi:hypothetical protein